MHSTPVSGGSSLRTRQTGLVPAQPAGGPRVTDVDSGVTPDRGPHLARASQALMAAVGDVGEIAQVLVDQCVELTRAVAAGMFQLRGGNWIRIAVAGITDRPIGFPLPLADAP